MKVKYKLQAISKHLSTAGIESPDKEAEIILRNALNMNVIDIYRDDPELTDKQMSLLESVVSRRTSREPLQYILGHVDFLGLKLQVGKDVLIPRPETELMAEYAINRVGAYCNTPLRILDLCTGSGCLALALAKEFPDAQVFGTDISASALSYARGNAALNGISNVSFIRGNLLDPFKNPPESPFSKGGLISPSLVKRGKGRFLESNFFDLIISNPPYIRSDDIGNLQPEIKDWEPLSALDGGTDGLDFYRAIIPIARQFLKDNGILMLEIGISQADTVAQMFECSGYKDIVVQKDYAGIERIISAKNLV